MSGKEKSALSRELTEFTNDFEKWIDDTLPKVGWDKEHLLQDDRTLVSCPVDSAHSMPQSALDKHLQYCPLVKQDYTREELDKQPSSQEYYKQYSNIVSLNIEGSTLDTILARTMPGMIAGGPKKREMPATLEREMCEFTQDERLAIYQYCIETAKAANAQVSIPTEDLMLLEDGQQGNSKPQSELERLASMRDLKRRRQSYKGKSTHTSKKSHLEVIKEVIENQTELLGKIWQEQSGIAHQLSIARSETDERIEDSLEKQNGKENGKNQESNRSGSENQWQESQPRDRIRQPRDEGRQPRDEGRRRRRSRSRESDRKDQENYPEKERGRERYSDRPRRHHRYHDKEEAGEYSDNDIDREVTDAVTVDNDNRRSRERRKRSRSRSHSRSKHRSRSRDRSRRGKHKHKKHKKAKHEDEETL